MNYKERIRRIRHELKQIDEQARTDEVCENVDLVREALNDLEETCRDEWGRTGEE